MPTVTFRRAGSPATAPAAPAALLALLLAVLAGCSPAASASAPAPSASPGAAASALASAVASGLANPSPLPMSVKSIDKNVKAGQKAGLTVVTEDGASCTIVVTYPSGPATDSGLAPAIAASNGYVQWGWTIPSDTSAGTVPVKVTCTKGVRSGELQTEFTVK